MATKIVQPLIEAVTCDICEQEAFQLKTPGGKININFSFKWVFTIVDKNDPKTTHSFPVLIQTGMDICDDDVNQFLADLKSGTLILAPEPEAPPQTDPLSPSDLPPNPKIVPMPTLK
jgi:hypothetical protein